MSATAKKSKRKSFLLKLITGDVLMHPWVKRQMGLIVLIVCLIVLYEGNRYGSQLETVRIQRLRADIIDLQNESVALRNELMQKSLQSNIERRLGEDNPLRPATAAPIVIE